jgi:hypothetical protein
MFFHHRFLVSEIALFTQAQQSELVCLLFLSDHSRQVTSAVRAEVRG